MGSWQKVYSDKLEHRAEIVKAVLEEHGIQPVLVNKKDTAYHWGQFEIHVSPDEVIQAIKIINDDITLE